MSSVLHPFAYIDIVDRLLQVIILFIYGFCEDILQRTTR